MEVIWILRASMVVMNACTVSATTTSDPLPPAADDCLPHVDPRRQTAYTSWIVSLTVSDPVSIEVVRRCLVKTSGRRLKGKATEALLCGLAQPRLPSEPIVESIISWSSLCFRIRPAAQDHQVEQMYWSPSTVMNRMPTADIAAVLCCMCVKTKVIKQDCQRKAGTTKISGACILPDAAGSKTVDYSVFL